MNRVLTALVLAPVVVAIVFLAPMFYPFFVVLLAALALLTVREFYDLTAAIGVHAARRVGLAATAALILGVDLFVDEGWPQAAVAVLVLVVLTVLIGFLARPERARESLTDAGATLLGVFYPGLMLATLGLTLRDFGSGWVVWMLLVVWSGDIAALYAGRSWGRRRLAPHVSPNKTYVGAAASLVAAIVVGWLAADVLDLTIWAGWREWVTLVLLAILVGVAAQVGDLVESVFKRAAHVKDSGSLLPGHGGIFDRIDAVLLAAPVQWLLLSALRFGVRS